MSRWGGAGTEILFSRIEEQAGLTPTEYGYIIRQTEEYVIDVTLMLYNWRLHVALAEDYGVSYEHGYCYFGTGPDSLLRAVTAGQEWDDPLRTHPAAYDKMAF